MGCSRMAWVVAIVVLSSSCGATSAEVRDVELQKGGGSKASAQLPKMILGFNKQGSCRNWNDALAMARKAACCGVKKDRPNRGDPSCRCQKALPCDICLFINDDRPPNAFFDDLGNDAFGRKIWGTITFPNGYNKPGEVTFERYLCVSPFGTYKLAQAMIHEATHHCSSIDLDPIHHLEETETRRAIEECLP